MAINRDTVISSMLWKLLERFSTQIVSFVISIILARLLLPKDYGVIAILLVFVNFANVIIDGGFNTALIQKKKANQKDFSTIFWFSLLFSFLIYLILYFTSPIIADFFHNEDLSSLLKVLGLCVIFNSFNSIQRAYVSRHMLFKKLFYVNGIALIISGGIGIIMALKGLGAWALVGQSLGSSIICCFLMWNSIRWKPTFQFSRNSFYSLFDYGWKIFLTNLIVAIYEDIRSLVIGKVYQPTSLAYFDRGKALPSLVMANITASINTVLLPSFAEEQDNRNRVKQMMRRSVQISYFFVLPLLVGFLVSAKEVVLILLTSKWLPVVPFIQIFCIAFILMPIQNINMTAIKSLGYSSITLKLELIKKILEAIILIVSFIINVYAVAWGIVLYNIVCIFINLYPSKKLVDYGLLEQIKDVFPTLLASIIMGGAIFSLNLFSLNIYVSLSIKIILGSIVYYLICRSFRLESYEYILGFIVNRKNKK